MGSLHMLRSLSVFSTGLSPSIRVSRLSTPHPLSSTWNYTAAQALKWNDVSDEAWDHSSAKHKSPALASQMHPLRQERLPLRVALRS